MSPTGTAAITVEAPLAERAQPITIADDRQQALRALARPLAPCDPRALEFATLRESGLRLAEIGRRYGLSRQRVAQIIDEAGRVPADEVRDARRDAQLERALARSEEVLECFRAGLTPLEIARHTELPVRAVRAVITRLATEADRAERKQAAAVPAPLPRYSDEQLIAGLRRVAERLGHAPSGGEYAQLADELGLAKRPTVYQRFGGWRAALQRAGLDAPPARSYRGTEWHLAACWNALVSIADQLGDPPRYRRYVELARQRDDLPSPATVRTRLGLWSGIAAELTAHAERECNRASVPQTTGTRDVADAAESELIEVGA